MNKIYMKKCWNFDSLLRKQKKKKFTNYAIEICILSSFINTINKFENEK